MRSKLRGNTQVVIDPMGVVFDLLPLGIIEYPVVDTWLGDLLRDSWKWDDAFDDDQLRQSAQRSLRNAVKKFGYLDLDPKDPSGMRDGGEHAEGIMNSFDDVFAALTNLRAYDDVAPALQSLRAAGVDVRVIGYLGTKTTQRLLAANGLGELVDGILVSAPRTLPDDLTERGSRPYLSALDIVGTEPEQVCAVVARSWELYYAESVGLSVMWIDRTAGRADWAAQASSSRSARRATTLVEAARRLT